MKVRELKEALVDADDDMDVQVPGTGFWRWVDASWAEEGTDQIGFLTKDPQTVPVFRIGAADS